MVLPFLISPSGASILLQVRPKFLCLQKCSKSTTFAANIFICRGLHCCQPDSPCSWHWKDLLGFWNVSKIRRSQQWVGMNRWNEDRETRTRKLNFHLISQGRFSLTLFLLKWAILGLFFVYLCLFKQTIFTTITYMWKKCPSGTRCWDSNSDCQNTSLLP